MFIHCHSVHDYPALPPEAAYKWPLKRGGQEVGRAEWPGCWARHSVTALSRSLFSHLFGLSAGGKKKRSMNKSRVWLPTEGETRTVILERISLEYSPIKPFSDICWAIFYSSILHYVARIDCPHHDVISCLSTVTVRILITFQKQINAGLNPVWLPCDNVFPRLLWCSLTLISCCWICHSVFAPAKLL